MEGFVLFLAVIFGVIAFLVLFFSSIVYTREKTVTIVELFGKYNSSRKPGLSFKPPWPLASQVAEIKMKLYQIQGINEFKTSDNVFLSVTWKILYRVIEGKEKEAWYEFGDSEKQISSYALDAIRSVVSGMTMEEVFNDKGTIDGIKNTLNTILSKYGYEIVNVLFDSPRGIL